jgi:hypothetical protein
MCPASMADTVVFERTTSLRNSERGSAPFDYPFQGRFQKAPPSHGGQPIALNTKAFFESRGDTRPATYNRGPFDIATLAIFPEYLEFEGQEVLKLVVEGSAGRTGT